MGALSLTAAAVSGLELPAWPDRHVRSQSHCLSGSGRTSSAVRARCPCSPGPAATSCSYRPSGTHVAHVSVRVFAHEPHRGFEPTAARFMMNDLTGMP